MTCLLFFNFEHSLRFTWFSYSSKKRIFLQGTVTARALGLKSHAEGSGIHYQDCPESSKKNKYLYKECSVYFFLIFTNFGMFDVKGWILSLGPFLRDFFPDNFCPCRRIWHLVSRSLDIMLQKKRKIVCQGSTLNLFLIFKTFETFDIKLKTELEV